jgi:hypothetical protein
MRDVGSLTLLTPKVFANVVLSGVVDGRAPSIEHRRCSLISAQGNALGNEESTRIRTLVAYPEKLFMNPLKTRLLAVVIMLIFGGMIYYNWHQLINEGSYSIKLAAFGPVGVVGGVFLLLFPHKGGKPETSKDKVIALLVLGGGLVAGLYNWYLMDPGFFGR